MAVFFAYCRIVATDIHFIACMRYRRGRPKGVPLWGFRKMLCRENAICRSRSGRFYELRVTRSDVVSLNLSPRSGIRRGRPVKASRYALRVSRSVVVSLSLSRRNAASESEKKAVFRCSWFVARKTMPHGPVMYITIYSRRAAQGSLYRGADRQRRSERLKIGPYDAAHKAAKTSHGPLTTNNKKKH